MTLVHLAAAILAMHLIGCADAVEAVVHDSGLPEKEMLEIMGVDCWRMSSGYLKEKALEGATIEVVCGNDGKISPIHVGKVNARHDLLLLIQNARDTRRDMGIFVKHFDGYFSTPVTSIEYKKGDAELLRERSIGSVVLGQPILADATYVFFYRPDIAWDQEKGPAPAFDSTSNFFIGLRFKQP